MVSLNWKTFRPQPDMVSYPDLVIVSVLRSRRCSWDRLAMASECLQGQLMLLLWVFAVEGDQRNTASIPVTSAVVGVVMIQKNFPARPSVLIYGLRAATSAEGTLVSHVAVRYKLQGRSHSTRKPKGSSQAVGASVQSGASVSGRGLHKQ